MMKKFVAAVLAMASTTLAHAVCVINATRDDPAPQSLVQIAGGPTLILLAKPYSRVGNTCDQPTGAARDNSPVTLTVRANLQPSPECPSGGCPFVCGPITVEASTFVMLNTNMMTAPSNYLFWKNPTSAAAAGLMACNTVGSPEAMPGGNSRSKPKP